MGYRADDSYFSFADAFVQNSLPLRSLNLALKLGQLGEQTILVSEKAFDSLKFIGADPVEKNIYYPKFTSRDSAARDTCRQEVRGNKTYRDDIFVMYIIREGMRNDAKKNLAECMDYGIKACTIEPDFFSAILLQSGYAEQFERGNPAVIAGMSGVELARMIISYAYPDYCFSDYAFSEERSDVYWAGWALAKFQWRMCKRFKDIFSKVPLSEIVLMYRLYHEMDISRFIEDLSVKLLRVKKDTHLKAIRESRGISQSALARLSGVKIRSIQLYEQRVNDIDRAREGTLYKLSRVLGCTVEDLLESPER